MYLHFWCLSPSVAFKEIAQNSYSVILTSGTLSPLDAMAYELKCDFEQSMVADHVIGMLLNSLSPQTTDDQTTKR